MWAHHMKSGVFSSPFFPDSKELTIYCWIDRFFQPLDVEARVRTHDLPATFCMTTVRL